RKGKDLAKMLLKQENHFHWMCNNPRKIGKEIYGIYLESTEMVMKLDRPQILIVVTSPSALPEIREQLDAWGKQPMRDFWFFA
ncbi:MAG: glycosyltransferase family 2 protein, partial [Bacteroidota bacterium]